MLKPYVDPTFESQKRPPPPLPELIDGKEEYEVKEILDSRLHQGRIQFLVKWEGYDEPTWEPTTNLTTNAKETIAEFYKKHPEAPRVARITSKATFRAIFVNTEPDRSNGWSGRPTLRGG